MLVLEIYPPNTQKCAKAVTEPVVTDAAMDSVCIPVRAVGPRSLGMNQADRFILTMIYPRWAAPHPTVLASKSCSRDQIKARMSYPPSSTTARNRGMATVPLSGMGTLFLVPVVDL